MKYKSGQEIQKGDKVLFHGEPAEIECVVDGLTGDAVLDWNMRENGPGVMIHEPKFFGHVYIRDREISRT